MSINYRGNKADSFTASDLPKIAPEMIRHHIAEGHRLRAEMMSKLIRKAFGAMARAGRTIAGWPRNRGYWSPGDQELRSR